MVREPDNPMDKYAIRLEVLAGDDRHVSSDLEKYIVDGTVKLGYVSGMYNLVFARLMDAGKLLYGVVDYRTVLGEYPKINVKIYLKDDMYHSAALPVQKDAPVPAPIHADPQPVVSGRTADYDLEEHMEGGYIIKKFRGIDEPKMVVPNDIGGKRIVGVGKAAYKGCLNIVSLIVSDGIEFLESEAFYGCRNLSDVQLPKTLKRIGGSVRDPYSGSIAGAFEETVITDIVLPERLEMLGARTFQHCINLKRIAIPVGITTIADMCFCGCSSLFVVVMPQKLTGINRCAFYSCNNLKHVALPPEVQTIGASAFHGCYALSDLQLNDGLQSIEAYAFDKCPNLHDVRIPRSVSKIEGCAFGSRPQKDNKDVTLRCYPGTAGLDYARENGFRIRAAE